MTRFEKIIPLHRKVIYGLITATLFVGLLEGASRVVLWLIGPGQAPLRVGWERNPNEMQKTMNLVYQPDDVLFFRIRPNLDLGKTRNIRIFKLRTNSLGLRGDEISLEKPRGTYRVLCVGDSCTFGEGAGTDETYPAQLKRELAQQRPQLALEVLNSGVPGFTSYQGRRYLETEGFSLSPDAVIITLGFSDTDPVQSTARRHYQKGLFLSDHEYGEALKRSNRFGITRLANRLPASWRRGGTGRESARPIHKTRVSPDEYRENMTAMIEQCQDRGILPLVVIWPVVPQADAGALVGRFKDVNRYQEIAKDVARQRGASSVDLIPFVRGRKELFIDEVHMNATGYRLMAKAIAEALGRHELQSRPQR